MTQPPAVSLRGIVKRYPRVVANDGVSLSAAPGSIHAIVGENGAGKSTLMKVLYGMVRPDEGSIELGGKSVSFRGPEEAIAAGIGMVHQHFMLVPPMSVCENVVLGAEPKGSGPLAALGVWDRAKARAETLRLAKDFGIEADPDAKVRTLSVGQQQRVEILKVLYRGAKVLILDEPTAVLTPQEAEALFVTLYRLRDAGSTILFISHKLKEVLGHCDDVTVLRRGKTIGTWKASELSHKELAVRMVGELAERADPVVAPYAGPAAEALRMEKVSLKGPRGEQVLHGLSLTVKAGEIVGVAGVEGNGQKELAEAACGLLEAEEGSVKALSPIAHVPEDRHKAGLLLQAPAWENMLLGRHWDKEFSTPLKLKRKAIAGLAEAITRDYDLQPPSAVQPAGAFSGGNQQKIVVGREISKSPRLLIVAHPTRGVDLGASKLIYDKIRQAKAAGAGVLLISSDLDEILALSDRVAVIFHGRIMGECPKAEASLEKLGLWMAGVQG